MCNVPFNGQVTKIREHNHFNGKILEEQLANHVTLKKEKHPKKF